MTEAGSAPLWAKVEHAEREREGRREQGAELIPRVTLSFPAQ